MSDMFLAAFILVGLSLAILLFILGCITVRSRWLGTAGLVKKRLLTDNELDFYRKLVAASSPDWAVLVQVAMGALVDTGLKQTHPKYWDARAKFAQKICDFVLCHPVSMAPVLIIELDDVMHDFSKDARRDSLTTMAGYQTLRFWSRKKPSIQELKQHIDRELSLNTSLKKVDKV